MHLILAGNDAIKRFLIDSTASPTGDDGTTATFILALLNLNPFYSLPDLVRIATRATTVGYGDIRPTGPVSKALSVLIAFIGLIFTGLLVALAINAATITLTDQEKLEDLQECIDELD